jgi:hypothetical protein
MNSTATPTVESNKEVSSFTTDQKTTTSSLIKEANTLSVPFAEIPGVVSDEAAIETTEKSDEAKIHRLSETTTSVNVADNRSPALSIPKVESNNGDNNNESQRNLPNHHPEEPSAEESFRISITPGAVRVAGMNQQEGQQQSDSQQTFLYDQQEEEQQPSPTNEMTNRESSKVMVAQVVDEEQLLHELLFRRTDDDALVRADHIATVVGERMPDTPYPPKHDDEHDDDDDDKPNILRRRPFTRRTTIAAAVICLVVVMIIIVIAVAVTQTKKHAQQQPSAPSPTIAQPPTAATPLSLLEAFRSILLEYSVSSMTNLETPGTIQYQALSWLASEDQALTFYTTSTAQTIIDRYILALIYFGTNGVHWYNPSNFLSNSSICQWQDTTNTTGVFCTETIFMDGNSCVSSVSNVQRDMKQLLIAFISLARMGSIQQHG